MRAGDRKSRGIHVIGKDRAPLPHRLRRDRSLDRKQPESNKTFPQLAVRLLSYQFVAGLATPEVDSGNVKEFPSCPTELLNQLVGVRSFARFGGNTEEKLLEALVGSGEGAVSRRKYRTADRSADLGTEVGDIGFAIHKGWNLMGN